MGGQLGLLELSVISWVSAVGGCPLSGVPLYTHSTIMCAGLDSEFVKLFQVHLQKLLFVKMKI